jgi:hypothetical protein
MAGSYERLHPRLDYLRRQYVAEGKVEIVPRRSR